MYADRLYSPALFAPRLYARGNDPDTLPADFLRAVQARIVRYMPAALEPVYEGGKLVRGDVWEGAVRAGVYPPYAQVVDTGSSLLRQVAISARIRRQTFRVSVFARDRVEVTDIADAIEDALDGRTVYFRDGRMYQGIQIETRGPRLDTTGTGLGGRNVWRRDDSYWAYLVRD